MTDKSKDLAARVDEIREELVRRVHAIDPQALVEISLGRVADEDLGFFSDWHDRWRDKGGGWSDGWGKAGGQGEVLERPEVAE